MIKCIMIKCILIKCILIKYNKTYLIKSRVELGDTNLLLKTGIFKFSYIF